MKEIDERFEKDFGVSNFKIERPKKAYMSTLQRRHKDAGLFIALILGIIILIFVICLPSIIKGLATPSYEKYIEELKQFHKVIIILFVLIIVLWILITIQINYGSTNQIDRSSYFQQKQIFCRLKGFALDKHKSYLHFESYFDPRSNEYLYTTDDHNVQRILADLGTIDYDRLICINAIISHELTHILDTVQDLVFILDVQYSIKIKDIKSHQIKDRYGLLDHLERETKKEIRNQKQKNETLNEELETKTIKYPSTFDEIKPNCSSDPFSYEDQEIFCSSCGCEIKSFHNHHENKCLCVDCAIGLLALRVQTRIVSELKLKAKSGSKTQDKKYICPSCDHHERPEFFSHCSQCDGHSKFVPKKIKYRKREEYF